MLSLLDLLLGDSLLLKTGIVGEDNKSLVFYILVGITFAILAVTLAAPILSFFRNGDSTAVFGVFAILFIIGAFLGFAWDILTSIAGLYKIFTPQGAITNGIVALILAIAGTTISFIITLFSPFTFIGSNVSSTFGVRLTTFIIFALAFAFDLYTSFVGNAFLLGLPVGLQYTGTMIILGICTLFVCFCQYVILLYLARPST